MKTWKEILTWVVWAAIAAATAFLGIVYMAVF